MSAELNNATVETSFPARLAHWAQTTPDHVAFREKDQGIWKPTTWREYERRVQRFARGLEALGLKKGDRVAIASEDTPEWLISDLATETIGGVVVGIYPTNPSYELGYIVRHSECRLIVCGDQEQVDKVLELPDGLDGVPTIEYIVCVDMKGMRQVTDPRIMSFDAVCEMADMVPEGELTAWWRRCLSGISPGDVNVIVYTSGTTGPPKGAQGTHRGALYTADVAVEKLGLDQSNYTVLCYLPLCHLAERIFSIAMHLRTGGVVNFAESIDTVHIDIREIGPSVFLGVPRIWEKMQQSVLVKSQLSPPLVRWCFDKVFARAYARLEKRYARPQPSGAPGKMGFFETLEYFAMWLTFFRPIARYLGISHTRVRMCGAAPVSPETLKFFQILGLPVRQVYGLTESGGLTFMQDDSACMNGCVGIPLPGFTFKLAEDGEVLIKGPSVFAGYLKDPEATARTFDPEQWLRSGDIGEFATENEIRIIDRKKEIIITSGGKNIAPSEIENALRESIYVKEAIIIGDGRKFLSALIVLDIDTVGHWAQQNQIPYTTYRSLAVHPEIRKLIAKDVDRANKRFARVENIRKFEILQKELDHDDGELTATQKVKRTIIEKKFAEEIARIYDEVPA